MTEIETLILVVEDEPSIAEIIRTLLEEQGYRVLDAYNGQEALNLLDKLEEPPDLILTDMMMPHIDGREMLRRLQVNPAYATIPIIIMSAATVVNSLVNIRYNFFLQKPFDIDTLLNNVNKIIGG